MSINKHAIPHEWQSKAAPHVEALVRAFQETNISSPTVYAYACASICHESSWKPDAENRTDREAGKPYSGKGLAQVTLQSNYQKISNFTRINFIGQPHLMFNPYLSLRAKAAHFVIHRMIPYIEQGDFEGAAGIYNAGKPSYRSVYTSRVANEISRWLPVFSAQQTISRPPNLSPFTPSPSFRISTAPPRTRVSHTDGPPRLHEPARAHRRVRTPRPPRSTRVYTVRGGDSFYAIARRFNVRLDTLSVNNPHIMNTASLRIGERINIPS